MSMTNMAKTQKGCNKNTSKSTVSSDISHNKEKRKQKQRRKQAYKYNRKARLIVRNLSFKTTEENFRKHFESYGEVQEVTILKRPNGELVGCGFVQFKTTGEAAQALLKTNANKFLGRPIHVDWAVAKDTYVRHLNEQENPENITIKSEKDNDLEDTKISIKEEPISDSEDNKPEVKIPVTEENQSVNESDNEDDTSETSNSSDDDTTSQILDIKPTTNLKQSANDSTDGKTVFIKNVPFDIKNEDLKECMEQFGEVIYALVCVDKLTEHSKGTAFVRFEEEESAQRCLSSGTELSLLGQVLDPHPALSREQAHQNALKAKEKPQKDSRNLYLIKEGVVLAGTKAADGVSASDMEKRLQLEHTKSQMLRNLNRFVSRFRLTIHNLPEDYDDKKLRALCSTEGCVVREARVMRDSRPTAENLKGSSKGFGFVSFASHEDALATLRRLNNNPTIFSRKKRPIVAFSIEDKAAMNTKRKRQQKSLLQNPNSKLYNANKNSTDDNKVPFKSAKLKNIESNVSNTEMVDYSGMAAKPGVQKMRTKFGLKTQAKLHMQNIKKNKKLMKGMKKPLKERKAQHIRQPRQKQNKPTVIKSKDDTQLSKLINNYKDKLNQGIGMKSKWYE